MNAFRRQSERHIQINKQRAGGHPRTDGAKERQDGRTASFAGDPYRKILFDFSRGECEADWIVMVWVCRNITCMNCTCFSCCYFSRTLRRPHLTEEHETIFGHRGHTTLSVVLGSNIPQVLLVNIRDTITGNYIFNFFPVWTLVGLSCLRHKMIGWGHWCLRQVEPNLSIL